MSLTRNCPACHGTGREVTAEGFRKMVEEIPYRDRYGRPARLSAYKLEELGVRTPAALLAGKRPVRPEDVAALEAAKRYLLKKGRLG